MSDVPVGVAISEAPASPRDPVSYVESWGW